MYYFTSIKKGNNSNCSQFDSQVVSINTIYLESITLNRFIIQQSINYNY